jgi:hypothetical protein
MRRHGWEVAFGAAVVLALTAGAARAEQRWQCGDGLSVPLTGSRAERDTACKDAREKRDRPPSGLSKERQAELEQRVQQLEKEYGVDIDLKMK